MQLSYKVSSTSFVRIIVVTFILSFFISFNLWGNDRSFPLFPVFDLDIQTNWIHKIIQYGFLVVAFICFVFPKKLMIRSMLIILVLFIFLDQLRLQPWVYFLSICILPFAFKNKESSSIQYLRIVFILVYIWSGIQKINPNFIPFIFESILVDGFNLRGVEIISILKRFGYIFPIIEISIGILILLKKTRKIGVLLITITHIFILYYLIFGIKGNYVIIPWNIFMMIGGFLLFYQKKDPLKMPKNSFLKITLLIVAILPIGYLIGEIDKSVSFSLYDGKLKSLYLLENKTQENSINFYKTLIKKGSIKDFNAWSFNEMNVPFYPEDRFIRQLQLLEIDSEKNYLLTEIPLWRRNLLGYYKTTRELKKYQLLDSIENVVFTESLYFPDFKISK
tara:strand:- start:4379 stop:5554 length:1176 start_codon:yes stop_codon:yes gene_type:complete